MRFVDAVTYYQQAIKEVEDPIIHYNLGLTYSKLFKPGFTKPIWLDLEGTFACDKIPSVKIDSKRVCLEGDDKRFQDCKTKADCPTDKYVCEDTKLCYTTSPTLAA